MSTSFVNNPITGRCYVQVTNHTDLQCPYPNKHTLTDGFKRVEVCAVHRDVLFRHNEIWKTQWRELQSGEEPQTEQEAIILLAEAMGMTVAPVTLEDVGAPFLVTTDPAQTTSDRLAAEWVEFNPLSDANDDCIVLEIMRNGDRSLYSNFKDALFHFDPPLQPWMWLYKIGNYARAACKAHHIPLPERQQQ